MSGRQLVVTRAWLLRARKKRIDEIKEGKFILSDDQTMTTALLFACLHSRNVVIHQLKVRGKTTYYRVMRELGEMGVIRYSPERWKRRGTQVGIGKFNMIGD
jgi:hypothetical protein